MHARKPGADAVPSLESKYYTPANMSRTTLSAVGTVAARASAASTTTAAPPAAASVGRCSRSPAAGACSRQSGRKSGTTERQKATPSTRVHNTVQWCPWRLAAQSARSAARPAAKA